MKLSSRRIAPMDWDPAPALETTPPIPSIPVRAPSQQTAGANIIHGDATIKQEPGIGNPIPSNYGNQAAMQRAGQQIHEKFGQAANAAVNQLQARAELAAPVGQAQNRPQNVPLPNLNQMTEEQRRMYTSKIQQPQSMQHQYLQAQQRASIGNSQTDGASESDWKAMVAERRAATSDDASYQADLTIRQQIELMSHEMEGGGLMLPLAQHNKRQTQSKRKVGQNMSTGRIVGDLVATSEPPHLSQVDGGYDSDEEKDRDDDEDAINSDLDDPDDDVVEETEEDANTGELILCTYDKVQRVKNKWKCTLKDGILTTGSKE